MYQVLKALIAKGVIKKVSAGQKNAVAKYALLPLAPVQCPEIPDADTNAQRPQNPDTTAPQCPQTPDTQPPVEGPEFPDTDESQCPGIPGSVSGNPGRLPQPPTTKRSLPPRDDVEQVCTHLADRIEENGSKRPAITAAWRDAARLLIDKDGRSPDQILRAIDWCQSSPFWRANVLSMTKLRERYDQLRLKATAERDAAQAAARQPSRYIDPAERGVF